ncbi:MAG: hypothetical protein ACOCXX_01380 [Planctomycetota bacterium]
MKHLALMTTIATALLLVASHTIAQDDRDREPGGRDDGDRPRMPRVILRRGDGQPIEMRGMPMPGEDMHEAHVLEVDAEKGTVKVELIPQTGMMGTGNATLFVKDGKAIRREDIPEQADVVGMYAPAVDRNAAVVVQLGPDDQVTLVQGMVRKVDDGKLLLRKSLVDRLDMAEAVVLVDGQRGSAELLQSGMLVSVLATGSFDQPKALVVTHAAKGDQSVKVVKARAAAGERRMPFGLMVVAGRPQEKLLTMDRNSRIDRLRWRRRRPGRDDEDDGKLTLKDLAEKVAGDKDLTVEVSFSRGRGDDPTEYVDRILLTDGNMGRMPGGGVFMRREFGVRDRDGGGDRPDRRPRDGD